MKGYSPALFCPENSDSLRKRHGKYCVHVGERSIYRVAFILFFSKSMQERYYG